MNIYTMFHVAIRISIIITTIEILIMFILRIYFNSISSNEFAIVNAVALVVLSIPSICIFVIKPFLDDKTKMLFAMDNIATTDPLTQLANRHLIVEHLNRVVAGCTRHHEFCAVLLINLDNFKIINERYGHEAGDTVLIEVARRLHAMIRSNDVVGRMGDDEFIVLLERLETDIGKTGDRIQQIAHKIIAMINMPIEVKSKAVHVSASIGIRVLGFEPINTDSVIREVDSAMYRAKEKGGNCAIVFDERYGPVSNGDLNQYKNKKMSIYS
jgi:two-component system cell cycle response regulator